ncbi:MAG TPA: Crp/Fnr family transcriptional regulator [Allosphingosinicella sp.]|nr:Crp/Fnr family transcriptional regulator [Allosphingosinicella sp.]
MSVSPLDPLIRKLEYRRPFSSADRAALLALPYEVKTIEAGAYIVRDGTKPTRACLVVSGFTFRHKIVAEGARQILSLNMRGDLVDFQSSFLGIADHNVQALTRSEVAYIPRDALRNIAFERPVIGEALWHDSLVDASIFCEWIANVGRRDSRTRLAHLLCEFSLRLEAAGLGDHKAWELPMTQEQLADVVGLTPVHVNRTLKTLEQDGLIRRNRRAVSVSNWKKLAEAGDFQSSYLHLPEHKLSLLQRA